MDPVIILQALGDNYIYLYRDSHGDAFVVDPGESRGVLETLKKFQLNLKASLITHSHFDHTGGIGELKKKTGCEVWQPHPDFVKSHPHVSRASRPRIAGKMTATQFEMRQPHVEIQIIATPGHTRDSVCYFVRANENHQGIVFTGDTLFIGGCGRIIESNARTMWQSLQKIASLPDETFVYPGHDYTLENYQFATQIASGNETLKKRLQEIEECQRQGRDTVPSTIAQEKASNIFLLAGSPEIKETIGMPNAPDAEVFAQLRKKKDIFG